MDRVKTGIAGFDELVGGGFPIGFNVLVIGLPGTGKTIFGLQFLINGAQKGEPGIYVSLDMADSKLREQAAQFKWDIDGLEKQEKLSILKVPLDREKVKIFDLIEEEVERIKAKRIIFDSLASFAINIDQFTVPLSYDDEVTRVLGRAKEVQNGLLYTGNSQKRITYLTLNQLSRLNTTNVIITDEISNEGASTVDGVSEHVCDGLIALRSLAIGKTFSRTMEIKKMRCTNIDGGVKSYEISESGIKLLQ